LSLFYKLEKKKKEDKPRGILLQKRSEIRRLEVDGKNHKKSSDFFFSLPAEPCDDREEAPERDRVAAAAGKVRLRFRSPFSPFSNS
jgi:hypothetical protein